MAAVLSIDPETLGNPVVEAVTPSIPDLLLILLLASLGYPIVCVQVTVLRGPGRSLCCTIHRSIVKGYN
jgi:hypothetical protein